MNGKLPKALSVKVVDGETGAPADAQITFTITGAANGAKFANEQTSISVPTESGIAAVSMWLGDTVGNYNVQVTCPADVCTSGVKEVLFTEKAVTTQDATKLTEMFCDGAHFYGQKLSNPLRVKALNLYTNEGVKDLAVTFKAKAGSPEGIIHTENTTTGLNGLASTYFTLGSALGTYTVIANCAQCLAGPTVECLVRGMYPPNAKHDSPEVGLNKRKRGVSITASPEEVYPQETGGSPAESIVAIAGASPNTSFTAQVVAGANTGGHQHHDAGRPKGTLVGWDGTICTGPSPITCTTSQNGSARLKYTSSEVGGWDTILIKMATGEEGDAIIKVRVPDLSSYPRNAMNHTYASNTEKEHPNFTYGTQELIDIIDTVASQYMTSMNNKAIISVNDMSLINGGVMDICSNWNSTAGCPRGSGHQSHRKGRSVDINSKPINPITRKTVTDSNFVAKLTELFRNQGCGKCVEEPIHFECPKTENCQ